MKITIVFLFVLIGSAVAQSVGGSVGSAPVQSSFEIQGHAQEAHYVPLDVNRDLLAPSSIISVQGDGSMGEWVKQPAPEPLGTSARRNRTNPLPYTNGRNVVTVTP